MKNTEKATASRTMLPNGKTKVPRPGSIQELLKTMLSGIANHFQIYKLKTNLMRKDKAMIIPARTFLPCVPGTSFGLIPASNG